MARAKFKPIIPQPLRTKAFEEAWANAAKEVVDGVKKDFSDATMFFHDKPVWNSYIRREGRSKLYISVGTTSIAFKYYDQGNGGVGRIIYPKRAKVLHWVDRTTNDDVFVAWVHGYEGRKVSETITEMWNDKMYEVFGKHLALATAESGHGRKWTIHV